MPFNWERVSRDSDEYKTCVAGTTGLGVVAGGITGAAGAALTAGLSVPALMGAGGVLGFATGYLACPYLAPKVKKKLFEGVELTDAEASNATKAMELYSRAGSTQGALRLVAAIRPHLVNRKAPKAANGLSHYGVAVVGKGLLGGNIIGFPV